MNGLIWIAQVVLAVVFLIAGTAKLIGYEKVVEVLEHWRGSTPHELSAGLGRIVGLLEIAGALGVIVPPALAPAALAPDYLLARVSAAGLAILMVAAGIYHIRRKESAAPAIAAFLLALFVIVGRWPH
jgi:uncharacterized membrane protein YphA (DoxX/SURF4 family)